MTRQFCPLSWESNFEKLKVWIFCLLDCFFSPLFPTFPTFFVGKNINSHLFFKFGYDFFFLKNVRHHLKDDWNIIFFRILCVRMMNTCTTCKAVIKKNTVYPTTDYQYQILQLRRRARTSSLILKFQHRQLKRACAIIHLLLLFVFQQKTFLISADESWNNNVWSTLLSPYLAS